MIGFQLTHSRGVRRLVLFCDLLLFHFNSRTHVECDFFPQFQKLLVRISTHALTWSATACSRCQLLSFDSFQLTHSRGVRRSMIAPWAASKIFQLTHSRGVRHDFSHEHLFDDTISTHALTWSATNPPHYACTGLSDFNSRTHVECDTEPAIKAVRPYLFQLTHSRGVRRFPLSCHIPLRKFQLTHSRGVRLESNTA